MFCNPNKMSEGIIIVKIESKNPPNDQLSFLYKNTAVKLKASIFDSIITNEVMNNSFKNDQKKEEMLEFATALGKNSNSIMDMVLNRIMKIEQSEK